MPSQSIEHRAATGLHWGLQLDNPLRNLLEPSDEIFQYPTDLILPSGQLVLAEGAHKIGAEEIKPRLKEWHALHPDLLPCYAHVGEPEGDPMRAVIDAMIHSALTDPASHDYDNPQGYDWLREAIAGHLNRRHIYPVSVSTDDIIITPGSKMAGYMTARSLLNQGDKAAISELAYPGHYAAILMNGGRLVAMRVDPKSDYRHDPKQMRETLEKYRPKLIYVCNPGNPSGLTYTVEEAQVILEYMWKYPDVVLLQDIIYKDLIYPSPDGKNDMVMFSAIPEIAGRVITNDGASKGPRATGWRMGCIIAPPGQKPLRDQFVGLSNALFAGTSRLLSTGLVRAYEPPGDIDIEIFRKSLERKRNIVVDLFRSIPGLVPNIPRGAFYALLNTEGLRMTAQEFYEFGLQQGVGMLTTHYFGATIPDVEDQPLLRNEIADNTVRWSFGGPLEPQKQGLMRLKQALAERTQ